MPRYLARRGLQLIPVLLGVSVVIFTLVNLAPGDPVDAMIPPESEVSPEAREQLRERLGLNAPAPERYARWLGRALVGDFGYSLASRRPISEIILDRLPATLQLMSLALAMSIVLGIIIGVVAAVKQYSSLDYILTFFAFSWLSIPVFFMGLIVIYVFAVKLNWFPAFGASDPGVSGMDAVWDRLHHLTLPGFTLGLELTAALTRYVRSSLLEVLHSDYMRTARAKGLQERVVVMRHGLRNALIPMITMVALRLPILIGGAVVIETVFQWPGLGTLTLSAANTRDYPLVMALALFMAVIVVVSSFLADLAYAVADPRIRYQ